MSWEEITEMNKDHPHNGMVTDEDLTYKEFRRGNLWKVVMVLPPGRGKDAKEKRDLLLSDKDGRLVQVPHDWCHLFGGGMGHVEVYPECWPALRKLETARDEVLARGDAILFEHKKRTDDEWDRVYRKRGTARRTGYRKRGKERA